MEVRNTFISIKMESELETRVEVVIVEWDLDGIILID